MKKIVYILILIAAFISGVFVYNTLAIDDSASNSLVETSENSGKTYVATAYCLRGKTASGEYVRHGIVAADPRLHRLGSLIVVTHSGRSISYKVADTGGAIKGNRIDIWMSSCSAARKFGRRIVLVRKYS